jgi:hypothetical protein
MEFKTLSKKMLELEKMFDPINIEFEEMFDPINIEMKINIELAAEFNTLQNQHLHGSNDVQRDQHRNGNHVDQHRADVRIDQNQNGIHRIGNQAVQSDQHRNGDPHVAFEQRAESRDQRANIEMAVEFNTLQMFDPINIRMGVTMFVLINIEMIVTMFVTINIEMKVELKTRNDSQHQNGYCEARADRSHNRYVFIAQGHDGPGYGGVQDSADVAGSVCRNATPFALVDAATPFALVDATHFALVAADVGHHYNKHVHRNATPFALVAVDVDHHCNNNVCRNATLFALVAADVDHHYNDNRNIEYYDIGRDVSPITYARPGLNVSRGSIHSAIPIGYDHKGDHNASGSIHSSGSDGTSDSRRLARDLSGLVSSPEVARPDTQHRRQEFQIPAGGAERSFQEIDAREERCPLGMTFKRTTVMYDRGASWMLQQSHESDPDTNVMIHGREALRTNDMMLNDICNRYPSPTIGARKILQADTRWEHSVLIKPLMTYINVILVEFNTLLIGTV